MATAMGKDNHAVNAKEINRAWRRYNVSIPEGEGAKAIRSLIARDVIAGQEKYAFTVELQRWWVQKYRRIEWVKEEVVGLPLERQLPLHFPWTTNPSLVRLLVIVICLLLLIGGSSRLLYTNYYLPNQQHASATATVQAISTITARIKATATVALARGQNPYPPYGGTLLLNAPLRDKTHDPDWYEGAAPNVGFCEFIGGAYHVEISLVNQFYYCTPNSINFSNFAYQVQMAIIKGDQGGISFRSGAVGSLYYFYIDTQGNYELDVDKNHNFIRTISSGSSPAIKTGYNQPNLIAVVAQGTGFDLYVNLQHLAHASDTTYSSGSIGVLALEQSYPTEVVFSNAKVWKL